jgi:hypothetical protein
MIRAIAAFQHFLPNRFDLPFLFRPANNISWRKRSSTARIELDLI